MPTFLTNPRMNPALAKRVRESLRKGQSSGATIDRRWTAAFRFIAVTGIAMALISLFVLRRREDAQIEQARSSLIAAVSQKRAQLGNDDLLTLDQVVGVLLQATGPYEGDHLGDEARGPGALSALLERPMIYVRGPADSFKDDDGLLRAALSSHPEEFVHCLIDPPRARTEKAFFERFRNHADHQGPASHVHRLYTLLAGMPLLLPPWKTRVKEATKMRDLSRLERELDAAKLDETVAAARARLVLFVMDEPGGSGGVTELDGERPHDVRVTLFDLEQRRTLLRMRRHVDPSGFSDRGRSSHAARLDACALSFDVREAVAKGDALTEAAPAR